MKRALDIKGDCDLLVAARVQEAEEAWRTIFNSVYDAIFIHELDGSVVDVNEQMVKLYQVTRTEARTLSILKDFSAKENPLERLPAIWQDVIDGHPRLFEWKARRPHDGSVFDAEVFLRKIVLRKKEYILANIRDITERKHFEAAIRHRAYHDFLTGLPNRLQFQQRLSQELLLAEQNGTSLAIMFLDLDGFKMINDGLGHDVGDKLLMAVALRLKECVRTEDTVARMGGDEFTLIAPQVSAADTEQLVMRVLNGLSADYSLDGKRLRVGVSIGISMYPVNGRNVQDLMKQADIAMYRAKEKGRTNLKSNYVFYE
ncbi:pas fold [Lucifera butyrica]|uniref:Pas fold n=1 Tax=Lucifera butyrica TaxID=1351585 RepID=A0A498REV2_9FIRM|nr:sensor domain-containing diguanylate cyclase [Lucifera butyrica]VBB09849.1 pas fold [Lucifera butyrica]